MKALYNKSTPLFFAPSDLEKAEALLKANGIEFIEQACYSDFFFQVEADSALESVLDGYTGDGRSVKTFEANYDQHVIELAETYQRNYDWLIGGESMFEMAEELVSGELWYEEEEEEDDDDEEEECF